MKTQEINENIIAGIEAQTGQTVPLLKRSFTRVIVAAISAVITILFKHSDFLGLQQNPKFASTKPMKLLGETIIPLVELGIKNGTGEPKVLATANYTILSLYVSGSGTILAGSTLTSNWQGLKFTVDQDTTIEATPIRFPSTAVSIENWVEVDVTAVLDGAVGNLLPGETLTWDVPNASYNVIANNYLTITEGADEESWEDYRARVVLNDQFEPQGGAYYDYVLWAASTVGVSKVYPYTGLPGQVDVYIEADNFTDASPELIAKVKGVIELDKGGLASRRPAGALVNVYSVISSNYNVNIFGLVASDLTQTKANIEAALTDYFNSLEPYIVGVTLPPRKNEIRISAIKNLIYSVVNEDGASVDSISYSGADFVEIAKGVRARLGTVNYL